MNMAFANRRQFLVRTSVAGVAAGCSALGASIWSRRQQARGDAASPLHPIRLGGPIPKPPADPEELALAHRKLGYRAAYCPRIPLDDRQRIADTEKAFAKHDVMISEVGRWVNLLDANPAIREELANGDRRTGPGRGRGGTLLRGYRRLAEQKGVVRPAPRQPLAAIFRSDRGERPQDHRCREAAAGEVLVWNDGLGIPDSPDHYLKLIKAVDRPAFAVHLDPCNIINCPERFYHNAEVLRECFEKMGPWIVSCHSKDLAWEPEMNIHFKEVPLGQGELDYPTYLKCLASLPADVPLMMEHMHGEEYDRSREYLFQLAGKIGVRLCLVPRGGVCSLAVTFFSHYTPLGVRECPMLDMAGSNMRRRE